MSGVGRALTIVMAFNTLLFFANLASADLNPGGTTVLNYAGSPLSKYDQGGYVLNESLDGRLPSSEASISPSTGNVFTDGFTAAKNWFLNSTGINYLVAYFAAVPDFIKSIGLPTPAAFAIGAMWWSIALFLFLSYLIGRDD